MRPADAATPSRSAAARPPTRWGDRSQRRVDILDAARERIIDAGYLALNMRDVAAGAGVSPATLYSYFATKEELFATLFAEAIRAHTDGIRPACTTAGDLDELLRTVISAYVELYRQYGRHFTLWAALLADADTEARSSPFPVELIADLRQASISYSGLVMTALERAAGVHGRRVVPGPMTTTLVWSAINGLVDHIPSERRPRAPFTPDDLTASAAPRRALAVTDPVR